MASTERYVKRVPSQHREKPRFKKTLASFLDPLSHLQTLLERTSKAYDVDHAIGKQLDVVGEWVGSSRYVTTPLNNIYFTWNGREIGTGWNRGQWKGRFDPSAGLVALDDDTYRTLIKLQIAANAWDGSVDSAYKAWESAFDGAIFIDDRQDMSITIGVAGRMSSTAQKAILTSKHSPFKPCGVRINYYFITETECILAWGLKKKGLGGWGEAEWAEKFKPNL